MKQVLKIGERIGNYTVEAVMNSGSFSEMYQVSRTLSKDYKIFHAFKVYLTHKEIVARGNTSDNVYDISKLSPEEQTDNELKMMLRLDHPNIIKPYDVIKNFDEAGHSGIVMEHMSNVLSLDSLVGCLKGSGWVCCGPMSNEPYYQLNDQFPQFFSEFDLGGQGIEPLLRAIDNSDPIIRMALEPYARKYVSRMLAGIGLQIMDAVMALRTENIVHNDLKTANILWDSFKVVKLIDFGISYVIEEPNNLWGDRIISPPERYIGLQNSNVDLWSMAIVGLELLLGFHPFESFWEPDREELKPEQIEKRNEFYSGLIKKYPSELVFGLSRLAMWNIVSYIQQIFESPYENKIHTWGALNKTYSNLKNLPFYFNINPETRGLLPKEYEPGQRFRALEYKICSNPEKIVIEQNDGDYPYFVVNAKLLEEYLKPNWHSD